MDDIGEICLTVSRVKSRQLTKILAYTQAMTCFRCGAYITAAAYLADTMRDKMDLDADTFAVNILKQSVCLQLEMAILEHRNFCRNSEKPLSPVEQRAEHEERLAWQPSLPS